MHDRRSTTALHSAGVAGESFVQSREFEWLSRAGVVARALGGYSLWRPVRAAIGHGPEGSDSGFERVAALASGIAYGAICAAAVQILLGSGGGNAGTPTQAAGGVLGWPAGTWIVGVAGGVMIGVALYQGYRGITKRF